jgi:hypothetical protein
MLWTTLSRIDSVNDIKKKKRSNYLKTSELSLTIFTWEQSLAYKGFSYPKLKVEQIEPPPLFGWRVEYAWFLTYVAELGNIVVKYGSSAYCEYGAMSSAAFAIRPSSWILSTSASRDTKFACKKLYLVK